MRPPPTKSVHRLYSEHNFPQPLSTFLTGKEKRLKVMTHPPTSDTDDVYLKDFSPFFCEKKGISSLNIDLHQQLIPEQTD